MNILKEIIEAKKLEIKQLKQAFKLTELAQKWSPTEVQTPAFYQRLAAAKSAGQAFFITEFKRKSPSEGWINQSAKVSDQIPAYVQAGASAISVLTDEAFFGGTYTDLTIARACLDGLSHPDPKPLLLQKDFILDPIQIYLAKLNGADMILLIAAILEPEVLQQLKDTAESLGLGVLVEVHDADELDKINHLDFLVLGINNRDLKTFRTALNRVNCLKQNAKNRLIVAESGVLDYRHFQAVRQADGFLIGTGLMRESIGNQLIELKNHFQTQGRFLFKACGIRTPDMLLNLANGDKTAQQSEPLPDYLGINFSPISKRRPNTDTLAQLEKEMPLNAVAVFYQNSESEILDILKRYPFKTIQCYAGDLRPEFIKQLKARILLAVKVSGNTAWEEIYQTQVLPYAEDIDCFLLDGPEPGSGKAIGVRIPPEFPYPFLLAGGLNLSNLDALLLYKNCIGADIASGIETGDLVDLEKLRSIAQRLHALPLRDDL